MSSWFSSKTATPTRATIRQQEIGILQRTMRDLQWTAPDETCIKTIMVGSIQLGLYIHIPPDYPQKPPVVRVNQPCQHQWVDSQGFLTLCPAISNWNPQSPSLVSLIQFVEAKFRETPPIPTTNSIYQPQQAQPQQQQQQPPAYGAYNPNQSSGNFNQFGASGVYQPPALNQGAGPSPMNHYGSQSLQKSSYGAPPNLNHSTSYVPPVVPPRADRPSYSSTSSPGGYNRDQSGNGSFGVHPQTPQSQQPRGGSFSSSPSTPAPAPETPKIKYASQAIPRPSTPQQPPDTSIQLAPIPPEPTIERSMIQRFPISKLEKLDNDVDEVMAQVGLNPVINQMYESLLKTQQEVDEMKQTLNRVNPQVTPLQADILSKKAAIGAKEAEFANLKRDYEAKLKEFDVGTFIAQLQKQLNELDDRGEDIMAKFLAIRNPSEDELSEFLSNYEKVRQEYHLKSVILKKLKMNLVK